MASLKSEEKISEPNQAAKECGKNGKVNSSVQKKRNHVEGVEFIAPDGGWGWVVAVACGLSNFSTLPLGQNFGLIYKEKFEEWGITQTEYSFMRNLEFSISSCTGLISGALLKKYGYRRMSLIGGCLVTLAVLITSQVSTIAYFTIFFGILGGIGGGISWPSNALALNTYFKHRRGMATGFSWTATGLSPVLMPQLITHLMGYTDVHGTVLILAGITLHSIPTALLLQPVHWHGKRSKPETEETEKGEPVTSEERKAFLEVPQGEERPHLQERMVSIRRGQVEGVDEDGDYIVDTQSTLGLDVTAPISRHSSRWSLASGKVRYSSTGHRFEDCHRIGEEGNPTILSSADVRDTKDVGEEEEVDIVPFWKRTSSAIVNFFDLTILKDPKFVTIFVGMTLAFAAEVNFTLLVPFVYSEFGFQKDQVALFMSTLALMDLITRFTVPFFTDKLKLDSKIMYSVGLTILATGRIVLAHMNGFKTIMAATLWMGFGKGLRTVYMALVIPSYVPLHRLPTASGLQMMANGIIFMCIGPLFGYLRDNSSNYTVSLHCINILTFGTVGLWTLEMLVTWCYRRKNKNDAKVKIEIIQTEGVV